ncbi:uncharacterized protein LOC105849829 isoform X2 [Hydra vulgaris]|uniref:uncharacterized protein LOC105849829 isoform X2 n=2 Tax=Hydra vulgaris TaxID=6087 RepID=UPI001F5F80FA|nr:uncharacterized protein LOC105849829 isoform X2 [Hydra vulgaris]
MTSNGCLSVTWFLANVSKRMFHCTVNDEACLITLNEDIDSDKKVMNVLSRKLASKGDSKIRKIVSNMIPMVIGTNIKKTIDWSGVNNKLASKAMPLKFLVSLNDRGLQSMYIQNKKKIKNCAA